MKTLLIDGTNLMKIGYHGAKDYFSDGSHVGGILHFINTIRKFLEEHNHDKVITFWDDISSSSQKKTIFPKYKENRRAVMNEYQYESFITQRERVKMYLEEVFIRQVQVENNEADDLIAEYCRIAKDEKIIIFSSDKDLTQLISENVTVYSPTYKKYYRNGDNITIDKVNIPHFNITLTKVLVGDRGDNVEGIEGLGVKTLVKLYPQVQERPCTIEEIIDFARNIPQKSQSKYVKNILTGKTKSGILGEEFFRVNKLLVDLNDPLITDEGKSVVEQVYKETIDPTDRGYKNLMRMMIEDGLFKFLPKDDEAWVNFLKPFMKLIRKEKQNTNKKTIL